jgi:antirestriction protein ArdC
MAMTKEEAQALTEKGLQALTEDPAQWQQWARTYAHFPRYSVGNVLMIVQQQPEASHVAGFHAWKELGRTVKKGEHGLAIYAPLTSREKNGKDQNQNQNQNKDRDRETHKDPVELEPAGKEILTGFRLVYVFDVAQTEGEPLHLPSMPLLHGEEFAVTWQKCVALSPVPVVEKPLEDPGLLGFYTPRGGTITIQQDQSPNQKLATVLHELGHYAGHPPGETLRVEHRHTEEMVAEITGFVLAERLGLDIQEQSLHYTAQHALGNRQAVLDTMAAVGARVTELLPFLERVQEAVQAQTQKDPKTLQAFAQSDDPAVRASVAQNAQVSAGLLLHLSRDTDPAVKHTALSLQRQRQSLANYQREQEL